MLPIEETTSVGYPRLVIIASSPAWSMDPKALVKSIYHI